MASRSDEATVFAHPARRSLYEALQRRGTAGLAEAAREAGVHPKTAQHHAGVLVAAGLLIHEGRGVYRIPGQPKPQSLNERILLTVLHEPGVHVAEVARRLGISRTCANAHVTDLLLEGVLESRTEGGMRHLFAREQPGLR